jgi:hypothetical protein
MELLLKCDEPALADASYRLIDLVDRVLRRHPGKAKPSRKLFSFYGFSGMSDHGLTFPASPLSGVHSPCCQAASEEVRFWNAAPIP